MTRLAIIGGGISGLAAAHRALELRASCGAPLDVRLLEAGERFGGVIRTVARDGCLLEAGPDSFVNDKHWAADLCRRLGLESELIPANARHRQSFVVVDGRLHRVPEGFYLMGPGKLWPFIASPVCSPLGKLRAALEPWVPPRRSAEDETIAAFVQRRFGRELLDRLAEPLISGMASGDVAQLSMQTVLPHILAMEREHGSVLRGLRRRQQSGAPREAASGARYGLFVSLRHGMQQLVDVLAARVDGVAQLRASVARVARGANGWLVHVQSGETLPADAVCLAVPPYRAAELLRESFPSLAQLLEQPVYTSWTTINLAYRAQDVRHPMDGFGLVIPAREHLPIVGCTFSHVKFSGRAPAGTALLRAFIREDYAPGAASPADFALESQAHHVLAQLLGISAAPLWAMVHRFPRALPQYRVGHQAWVAAARESVAAMPGLALAGNAFSGHGVTHCIHSGELAVETLLQDVCKPPQA